MRKRLTFSMTLIFIISSCSFFDIDRDPDNISDWITLPDSGTVYSYYENKRYYDEASYMYYESITLLEDSFYKIVDETLYINSDTIPCRSAIAIRSYETYHETTKIEKGVYLYKITVDTMFDRILYFAASNESSFYLWDFEIRCPIEENNIWMQRNTAWSRITDTDTSKEVLAGDFYDVVAVDLLYSAAKIGELYYSCELGVPIYQVLDSFETRFADEIELVEVKR
ncbi:MAG: hypothetical protein PHW02_04590 [bacterium]|nr:hypothetical protein [bacterium]